LLNLEENLLLKVIILFDERSNKLVNIMAKKFNLKLNEKHPFSKLLSRQNDLWKGKLNEKWDYWFHGDSYEYKKRITLQILEIRINRQNHRTFDAWALFHFIETSQSLNFVFKQFNTDKKKLKTLNNLENKKRIIRIGEFPINTTLILNKNVAEFSNQSL
jgi:hypothetical protein